MAWVSWESRFSTDRISWFPLSEENPSYCIWPDEFAEDSPEAAWRFVRECYTWNEQAKRIDRMPDLEYLEKYCWQWHAAKAIGGLCICEKCRRMIISWEARCLELHQMGLGRCDQMIAGEEFAPAAKHVWRLSFVYSQLASRHPEWELPPHTELKHSGSRQLKLFGLDNGSICQAMNGQAAKVQGDGATIITLEEACKYRHLANVVSQAQILTLGTSTTGTLVNLITNTPKEDDPGVYDWDRLIAGWDGTIDAGAALPWDDEDDLA